MQTSYACSLKTKIHKNNEQNTTYLLDSKGHIWYAQNMKIHLLKQTAISHYKSFPGSELQ